MEQLDQRGLVMLGCGKMGTALLQGWLAQGLNPASVTVLDPTPAPWLAVHETLRINGPMPDAPALVVLAVKPQLMATAIEQVVPLAGPRTLFLSIAAGLPLDWFSAALGAETPVIRAMPNTPAAVGQGVTALIGNAASGPEDLALATALMSSVGQVVALDAEAQMDAVTALSGSGPAYVFHLIETLTDAGVAQGLSRDMALTLARATVAGSGALAESADEPPEQLRVNVTSPRGTTEAGLKMLMDPQHGLGPLVARTVAAAADRSRELGA